MRIFSIVGHKNAGKTTLVVALAREFQRRGKKVATISHSGSAPEVDRQGTDGWRHFHEGNADGVMLVTPEVRALYERRTDNADPEELARHHFGTRDLVIVEGFERSSLPKIEIFRKAVGSAPLVLSAPDRSPWVALLSDTAVPGLTCPVLRFTDTMWLQLLAALAWDHARVADGTA